jgi:hypothetical protein
MLVNWNNRGVAPVARTGFVAVGWHRRGPDTVPGAHGLKTLSGRLSHGGQLLEEVPGFEREVAGRRVYATPMHTFASIAIGLLMFATVAVLFAGLIGMVRGQSGATSNKLMRYRVLLQGATLLLLMIFMSLLRS